MMGGIGRRGFLKALGIAPVVGPEMAKVVIDNEASSRLGSLSMDSAMGIAMSESNSVGSYYTRELHALLGKTAEQLEYERRTHQIDSIDPGVSTLKSVALHRKISMSRDLSFDARRRSQIERSQKGILGWFDYDDEPF